MACQSPRRPAVLVLCTWLERRGDERMWVPYRSEVSIGNGRTGLLSCDRLWLCTGKSRLPMRALCIGYVLPM